MGTITDKLRSILGFKTGLINTLNLRGSNLTLSSSFADILEASNNIYSEKDPIFSSMSGEFALSSSLKSYIKNPDNGLSGQYLMTDGTGFKWNTIDQNYNSLKNKPSLNGTTLSGNLSLEDLSIQEEITPENKLDYELLSGTPAEDYTTFEILANDISLQSGTTEYLGNSLSCSINGTVFNTAVEIPIGMTHSFTVKIAGNDTMIVDWGDNTTNEYTNSSSNSSSLTAAHTYSTPGKYTIKVYGKIYRIVTDKSHNLIYRIFDTDLSISKYLTSWQQLCQGALRLISIKAEDWGMNQCESLNKTFDACKNLRLVEGFGRMKSLVTCTGAFMDCINMISCDFKLPPQVLESSESNAYRFTYYTNTGAVDKYLLSGSLLKIFPDGGFNSDIVDLSYMFNYENDGEIYSNLTLSESDSKKLAKILWETEKTFFPTSGQQLFRRFTSSVRQYVPTSWGGTNTEIQAKIDNGYYEKVSRAYLEQLIGDAEAALSGIINEGELLQQAESDLDDLLNE